MAHRNAEFYPQDIVFQVEDELFKVSKHLFVQNSRVFRDMFDIPQPEDGSSDERPLILEGIEKQAFIQLLRCLYLHSQRAVGYGFSLEQWNSVLKLSNLYGMIEVKDLAVENMTPLLEAESPSLQIHLAQVHDVPKWLEPAKTRLVERSNSINEDDVRLIGPMFALEVCALREKALREMALRERTLLEKALEEKASLELKKALLEKTLQEKMLQENVLKSFNFNFKDATAAVPDFNKNTAMPNFNFNNNAAVPDFNFKNAVPDFNFNKNAAVPEMQPGQKQSDLECKNQ